MEHSFSPEATVVAHEINAILYDAAEAGQITRDEIPLILLSHLAAILITRDEWFLTFTKRLMEGGEWRFTLQREVLTRQRNDATL